MKLAADKIGHIKAGAMAAAFGAVVGAVLGLGLAHFLGLQGVAVQVAALVCAGVGAILSALSAGITKERADQLGNLIHPGTHGVEWKDAAATAAPGVLLGAALFTLAVLLYQGLL